MSIVKLSRICLFIYIFSFIPSSFAQARTFRYDCFWQYDPVKHRDLNPLAFRFTIESEQGATSIHGETMIFRYLRTLTFEILSSGDLKITLSGAPGNGLWNTYKIGETFEFTNDKDTTVTCLALSL